MAHKNWIEIYNFFLGNENASYSDLAKKFHVPLGSIKYRAAKEHWHKKREQIMATAIKQIEEETTVKIAELKRQQADFGRMLQGKAAQSMANEKYEPKSAHQIKEWIDLGVKLERDGLGMNTNQVYTSFKTKKDFEEFVRKIIEATKDSEQTNETIEEQLLEKGTHKDKS